MKQIDSALKHSENMVVVGSSVEHLMSGWVEADWRLFINEMRSKQKSGNLVTVVSGSLEPRELPMGLRYYEVIPLCEEGLSRLLDYI